MKDLPNYKSREKLMMSKKVTTISSEMECILCGSIKELYEDPFFEGIHYCKSCLYRAILHDEMIAEGYEIPPEVGD